MPDFPAAATPLSHNAYSMALVDISGQVASASFESLPVSGGTSGWGVGAIAAFRGAILALTNAGLFSESDARMNQINKARAETYDEAFSSVRTKLALVFQNDMLVNRTITIPAVDAQFLSGKFPLPYSASAAVGSPQRILSDAIDDIRTALNGGTSGAGTFAYTGGYLAGSGVTPQSLPTVVEAEAGDEPSGAPALP